jgi:hypothetical protein
VYAYELTSPYKVSDATREKLLAEIDEDEFFPEPLPDRLLLNRFEEFFRQGQIDIAKSEDIERLAQALDCQCSRSRDVVKKLVAFARLEPRLPDRHMQHRFKPGRPLDLSPDMSREEMIARIESLRNTHPSADLAFYAARDFARIDPTPIIRAAIERNPVSIQGASGWSDRELIDRIANLPNESIYEESRIAQPDEVWNFGRGDGLERALCLANIWKARHPDHTLELAFEPGRAMLCGEGLSFEQPFARDLQGRFVL